MSQIDTTELPETLQRLLQQVEETNTPLTITQAGKPLVIVYPASRTSERLSFGFAKGTGEILGDIVAPVEQPWEVM